MRYLFCSVASPGLIGPSIGIAHMLRRRGHAVAFATDSTASSMLTQAGMERIPRGGTDGRSFQIELVGHPLDVARQVKHIEYALEQFRPDVLVGQQLTLGPLIAGRRHKLPVAVIGLAAYILPTQRTATQTWPRGTTLAQVKQEYGEYLVSRYQDMLHSYNLSCDVFGLPRCQPSYAETPLIGDLLLLRSVPELEGATDDLPTQVHFVGDCSWTFTDPQDDPSLAVWLTTARASGKPILYVQPGRSFNRGGFWSQLVDALEDQPVWVAASVGRMDTPLTSIPSNFLVRDHVDQSQVLPYANAVISNSTSTAVLGALTHGLPMLLISGGGGEQYDLIARCLRAHVALDLAAQGLTAEMLKQQVDRLLRDASLHQSAQHLKDSFAKAGSCERAADLLEALPRLGVSLLRGAHTVIDEP